MLLHLGTSLALHVHAHIADGVGSLSIIAFKSYIFDLFVLFFSKSEKFNEILSSIPNAKHSKTTTTNTEWSAVDIHKMCLNLNSLLCPILHPNSMCSNQKKIKSAFAERRASQKFTVSASGVRALLPEWTSLFFAFDRVSSPSIDYWTCAGASQINRIIFIFRIWHLIRNRSVFCRNMIASARQSTCFWNSWVAFEISHLQWCNGLSLGFVSFHRFSYSNFLWMPKHWAFATGPLLFWLIER